MENIKFINNVKGFVTIVDDNKARKVPTVFYNVFYYGGHLFGFSEVNIAYLSDENKKHYFTSLGHGQVCYSVTCLTSGAAKFFHGYGKDRYQQLAKTIIELVSENKLPFYRQLEIFEIPCYYHGLLLQ